MRRVFTRPTPEIQNAIASAEQAIDHAPHGIPLRAPDRSVSPQFVVADGEPFEQRSGAHASTSLYADCKFWRTNSASAAV
jgi:hypothetical protein